MTNKIFKIESDLSIIEIKITIETLPVTKKTSEESSIILDTTKLDKLKYARKVLNSTQYRIIGVKWISHLGMTIEKLDLLADDNLSIELIQTIGGEALVHKDMTIEKLLVIPYALSKEEIEAIGVINLCHKEMTHYKIQAIGDNLSIEEIIEIGGEKLVMMSLAEILLSKEKYDALGSIWKEYESNIVVAKITAIKKYLSIEQIIAIGPENIIKEGLDSYKLTIIGKNYTVDSILEKGGNYFVESSYAEILLDEKSYKTLSHTVENPEELTPRIINLINDYLIPEQIKTIPGDIFTKMKLKDFKNYPILKEEKLKYARKNLSSKKYREIGAKEIGIMTVAEIIKFLISN